MHISRIGLTALKGARHRRLPFVDLMPTGPVGDRMFCLVDLTRGRVLRTIENPSLMQSTARWHDGVLTVELPGGAVEGVPAPTGELRALDYWGRSVSLEIVEGPWAAAFSAHLGHDVALARARAGDVVYGASVSLITTASLDELSRRLGTRIPDAVFRSTFTVHTEAPHLEHGWIGRRLALGDAEVEIRATIPRCRIVDLDPDSGAPRAAALKALAGYRGWATDPEFGVDAVVTRPGRVHEADRVALS